ncbi:MAG: AsmA family protein [Pseudomonadota bacterium]
MRKLLIGAAGVLALIVLLLIVAPFFIPASAFRGQIETQASAALGRDVSIGEELSLSLFPSFKFQVSDLTIANAPDMTAEQFAKVARADIGVRLLPLLGGNVAIDRFVLEAPQISLERNAAGDVNWMLGAPSETTEAPAEESAAEEAAQEAADEAAEIGDALPGDVRLGDVRITDGVFTYADAVAKTSYAATDVDLDVTLDGFASPLKIDGGLIFQDKPISLNVLVSTIRAIEQGKKATLSAALKLADAEIDFDAKTRGGDALAYDGSLKINAPSLRELITWLGGEAPMAYGFGPLQVSGALTGDDHSVAFEDAKIRFDEIRGAGGLSADWSGERPALAGALKLSALDLRPYVPEAEQAEAAALEPWSRDPIDFSALGAADLDFKIETASILLPTLTIDESALSAKLENKRVVVSLDSLKLYDGAGAGRLVVNGRSSRPSMSAKFDLTGLQARPFVKDASGFDRISGVGELKLDVTTAGRSIADFVSGLNGSTSFEVADGALVGINLTQTAQALGAFTREGLTGALAQAASSEAATQFTALSAAATIVNGVATTNNINLVGPYIEATGGGQINLPAQTVDLRLNPKVLSRVSSETGEDEEPVRSVGAPLVIRGKLDNASVSVDAQAAVKERATQEIGRQLDRLLGGGDEEAEGNENADERVGEKLIRGLFNND